MSPGTRILQCAVVALLVGACASGAEPAGETSPTSDETGPAEIEPGQLESIVLQPDEAPSGTTYQEEASGSVSLEELASGLRTDPASLGAPGFEAAHQSVFPGRATSGSGPPMPNEVQGVVSLAVLFEDADAASAFLESRFPDDQRIPGAEYSEPDVGEESIAVVTEPNEQRPRVATVTWRRANLYVLLNVFGDYSFAEVLEMARTIDGRAVSSAS